MSRVYLQIQDEQCSIVCRIYSFHYNMSRQDEAGYLSVSELYHLSYCIVIIILLHTLLTIFITYINL